MAGLGHTFIGALALIVGMQDGASCAPRTIGLDEVRFSTLDDGRGEWRGYVRGTSPLSLVLVLSDGGKIIERRGIGKVAFATPGRCSFLFKTALPRKNVLSWKICAWETGRKVRKLGGYCTPPTPVDR